MIEINERSYIVGCWFSENPTTGDSWLGMIIRDPENPNRYKGYSRFRYKKDPKVLKSKEEKSWCFFYLSDDYTDDKAIQFMNACQKQIDMIYSDKDSFIVKGNVDKFMEIAGDKEWLYLKEELFNE